MEDFRSILVELKKDHTDYFFRSVPHLLVYRRFQRRRGVELILMYEMGDGDDFKVIGETPVYCVTS